MTLLHLSSARLNKPFSTVQILSLLAKAHQVEIYMNITTGRLLNIPFMAGIIGSLSPHLYDKMLYL